MAVTAFFSVLENALLLWRSRSTAPTIELYDELGSSQKVGDQTPVRVLGREAQAQLCL